MSVRTRGPRLRDIPHYWTSARGVYTDAWSILSFTSVDEERESVGGAMYTYAERGDATELLKLDRVVVCIPNPQ